MNKITINGLVYRPENNAVFIGAEFISIIESSKNHRSDMGIFACID